MYGVERGMFASLTDLQRHGRVFRVSHVGIFPPFAANRRWARLAGGASSTCPQNALLGSLALDNFTIIPLRPPGFLVLPEGRPLTLLLIRRALLSPECPSHADCASREPWDSAI